MMKVQDLYDRIISDFEDVKSKAQLSRIFTSYDIFQRLKDFDVIEDDGDFYLLDCPFLNIFIYLRDKVDIFMLLKKINKHHANYIATIYEHVNEMKLYVDLKNCNRVGLETDIVMTHRDWVYVSSECVRCTECGKYIKNIYEEYRQQRCEQHTFLT